jgi:hypothetical protein
MDGAAKKYQSWMPASWLYIGLGATRTWSNLNNGDRLLVVALAILGIAIPIRVAVAIGAYIGQNAPAWLGVGLGGWAFVCIALTLSLSLANVRTGQLFQFLGEASHKKHTRIGAEWAAACILSALLLMATWFFLSGKTPILVFVYSVLIAASGHSFVAVGQFLFTNISPSRTNPTGLIGLAQRSGIASAIGSNPLSKLPPTSSRFLLKANQNPLIWLIIILTLLATGGAAISLKSLLLGLSTLSTVLMIIQLTLAEPRVGNGRAIGACSKRMPISRAISDLVALSLPHLACFLLAMPLIIMDAKGLAFGIGLSQLVATIWIIWITLLVRALPAAVLGKSARWLVALAIIASQIMPPVIIALLIMATVVSTREVMRLSQQGPALWPI